MTEEELNSIKENFTQEGGILYKCGKRVGNTFGRGYRRFYFKGRSYLEHRVIYYLAYGIWPGAKKVDHINGIRDDNRPENLRLVSQGENLRSFAMWSGRTTSKYRGVSLYKKPDSTFRAWRAKITINGASYHLGYYTSEEEAALAYNYKAMELGFHPSAYNKVF